MVKLKSILVSLLIVYLNDNCKGIKTEVEVPEEFVRIVMNVFFQDQESVTYFDVDKEGALSLIKFKIIRSLHSSVSLIIYDGLNDSLVDKINDMGDELVSPSTTKGYVVITGSLIILNESVIRFARINTNGKWMMFLVDLEISEAKTLLKEAWTNYKMINILVILVDLKQYKFTVISYNPFILNDDESRGHFWNLELNSATIEDAVKYIDGIYERKVKNLHGFPLNVIMFELEVTSKPILDGNSVRYKFLDGVLAQMFQSYLNCRINFMTPRDNTNAGIRYANGSFTGALLEMEKGTVDFSGNLKLMMPIGTTNTTFLKPIDTLNLKYMVPKCNSSVIPLNYTVLHLFNYQARLLFLTLFIFMVIVWYFLRVLKFNHHKSLRFQDLLLYIISTQSGVGVNARKFSRNHDRIMLVSLLILSLIICNTFQGVITRNLSLPGKSKDINTLEDLIKSDLKLMALLQIKDLFKPNADESNVNQIQKKLYQRQIIDFSQMGHLVEDLGIRREKIGILARESFLIAARAKHYDHETGRDVIHIVDETPITFYSSFMVPKTSPFITVFNSAIYLIREAGFIEHSLKTNLYRIELQRLERYKKGLVINSKTKIIRLQHFSHLFYFWFICIIICCVVFIGELIMFKINNILFT